MILPHLMYLLIAISKAEFEDVEERPVEREAQFTSIPSKILVNEGDTIRLPCFVDKIEGYVLLWKFGETILSVGGRVIEKSRERRLHLEEETNGNFLMINNAESSDGGEYMCQISAYRPKDIVHSVIVRTKPEVQVEFKQVIANQGDNVTLKCNIIGGHPVPELSWARPTGLSSKRGEVIFQHQLKLNDLTITDSGDYICRGDNGFTSDHFDIVKLLVQGPPLIRQDHFFIHSSQGGMVPVLCHVISHPPATVLWYISNKEDPLSDEQYDMTEDHVSGIYTLLVPIPPANESSKDIVFRCVANNTMGSATKVVTISSRPSQPKLDAKFLSVDDTWLLTWECTSWPRVSFKLELQGPDLDKEMSISATKKQNDYLWEGLYSVVGLAKNKRYQARVKAVSDHGEGPYSAWIEIDTDQLVSASASDNLSLFTVITVFVFHLRCYLS